MYDCIFSQHPFTNLVRNIFESFFTETSLFVINILNIILWFLLCKLLNVLDVDTKNSRFIFYRNFFFIQFYS